MLLALAPDDKAIYLLGVDSLLRLGDILDLRKADRRGAAMYIADPKDPTQSEPFEVPLSKRTRAALGALPKTDSEYLFPRRRRAKTERDRRNTIRQVFELACKRARVPFGRAAGGFTFHWGTRRTGATRMIRAGVDVKTVQEVGHWQTADVVLGIYAEGSTRAARRAVEVPGQSRRGHATK